MAVLLLAAPCFMAAKESGRGMERRRNFAWALVAESLATILMCWQSSWQWEVAPVLRRRLAMDKTSASKIKNLSHESRQNS